MYNVNLITEDKDFAKMIMNCIGDSLDEFEPEGYTSYSMSNVKEDECCECDCDCCDCEEKKELKGLSFGSALNFLIENPEFSTRLSFWGEDSVIKIQTPDKNSKMSYAYLYMETDCDKVPYIPNYIDMFSNNWEIVE